MQPRFRRRLWTGIVVGLIAGLCSLFTPGVPDQPLGLWTGLLLGAASGITFALLFGQLARTPGGGLLWGVNHGLLGWFVVSLALPAISSTDPSAVQIEQARAAFPQLFRAVLCYGGLVGLLYAPVHAAWSGEWGMQAVGRVLRTYLGAAFIGALAGLIGGMAFGTWMARVGMFPLIAGLMGSEAAEAGRALHFAISMIIGASYGLLFRSDVKGLGPSIAWGITYGIIWWMVGALTLLPWWTGRDVAWTLMAAQEGFGSLIGHLVYGVILGIVYAAVDRLVRILFTESDPLYRNPEGPGTRSLRALGIGALGSAAGGLVFSWVMVETEVLPLVANLIGQTSSGAGFLVHMAISTIIGATYGLLFWRESANYGESLAWGLIYGFTWWILGPLTLMPILLGTDLQWTLTAALEAYPSLTGHLAYGSVTALVSHALIRRYTHSRVVQQWHQTKPQPPLETPAAPLWSFVLIMGIALPLLLAG